jgi:catechol 2,3-dioxygenase-like lactoylglutathione lyase family enzyme
MGRQLDTGEGDDMASVNVRYIVDDVDAAVDFYTGRLGFEVEMRPAPGFAVVARDGLHLLLSGIGGPGGAAQPMADGRVPEPGGWNRIQLEVDDLAATVDALRAAGARFRTDDIIEGRGGNQILVDDPSGNAVELFEPHRG